MTEERDEPNIPLPKRRPPPDQCPHGDMDRVGAFEVVCFQCGCVADWRELMAGNKNAWKPLSGR